MPYASVRARAHNRQWRHQNEDRSRTHCAHTKTNKNTQTLQLFRITVIPKWWRTPTLIMCVSCRRQTNLNGYISGLNLIINGIVESTPYAHTIHIFHVIWKSNGELWVHGTEKNACLLKCLLFVNDIHLSVCLFGTGMDFVPEKRDNYFIWLKE